MSTVSPATSMNALKMVILAVDEFLNCGGFPPGDDEAGDGAVPQATTMLELVKQYAGNRVPDVELVRAIDAVIPLFPSIEVAWK